MSPRQAAITMPAPAARQGWAIAASPGEAMTRTTTTTQTTTTAGSDRCGSSA